MERTLQLAARRFFNEPSVKPTTGAAILLDDRPGGWFVNYPNLSACGLWVVGCGLWVVGCGL